MSERVFKSICFAALALPIVLLVVLFGHALVEAMPRLNAGFILGHASRRAQLAGILPPLAGSAALMLLTAIMAIPVGVGAAIYLEEYAKPTRFTSWIEINISNLAGVPSIIYGLLGLEVFVRALHLGRSLVAGAATLALLLLPMVIMSSREALRTVPRALREASYALGGERWGTLWHVTLPMCLPGILTGIVLSLTRAVGETAPLVVLGALTFVTYLPDSIMSEFTALPIQIFSWVSRPQAEFRVNAAAGIVVLLTFVALLNAIAFAVRSRFERRRIE